MSGRIRFCRHDQVYTLARTCPRCGSATVTAHPARFSPHDHYGEYRRRARGWSQ